MSGTLLPNATKASPTYAYYGTGGGNGVTASTINTGYINASTFTAAGDINTDIGVDIRNQAFLTFSGGAAVDTYTMGIQNVSSTVIPYQTGTLDRNVLQVSGYGDGDAPAGLLTGSLYLNRLGTNIPLNTQCATLRADSSANITMLANNFRVSTSTGFYNGINVFSGNVEINDNFTVFGDTTLAATVVDGNVTVGAGYTMAAGTTITNTVSTGTAFVGGKPVVVPALVPYVGVVGTGISVPAGTTQTISNTFSVIANHSYRITVQARVISGDTNPGAYVELVAIVAPSEVGLGRQVAGPNNETGAHCYVGFFKAVANLNNCVVQATNAAIGTAIIALNPTDASYNPGILLEDLGVL